MRRKLPPTMACALLAAAIILYPDAGRLEAIAGCGAGYYQLDPSNHSVVVYADYEGVDVGERPSYLYVDWGDGTSDFAESLDWPSAYIPIGHSYAAFGGYNAYAQFGTVQGGYCGSTPLFIYAP